MSTLTTYAGRLVDLRGVGRLPAFSGEEADWPEWRFRVENCADLIDMGDAMTMVVQEKQPIEFNRLLSKYAQRAELLYGVLLQVCSGRALSLLRLVGQRNGLEGWRQLVVEYEPATASRATAMLAALMTPTWGQRHFLDELLEWEKATEAYEAASGEAFGGNTRCAVVTRWAPDPVRDFLFMTADEAVKDWTGRSCVRPSAASTPAG